ncbi:MAG: aminotransferase class IV [Candidatus Paceibacterota bacterium]|jgi:branched-chain amino acid aminotransferase
MLSYANGKFISTDELTLPVKEDLIGTFRGFRIFTACRTLPNKKIFRLEDHIDRLFSCAKAIHMELPHNKNELKEIVQEVITKNNKESGELLLEIMYSGGKANSNGIALAGETILYILVLPLNLPPEKWYQQGIKLASFSYQRQWPEVKFLNYVGAVIAHQTVVKEYKADEALFISPDEKNIVLEGTTFNFFAIKKGVLLTHALDGKILSGITRKVVLELAHKEGIEIRETDFSLNELAEMDEAFITSSTRNIVPVIKVDNIIIGNGKPGELTLKLARILKEYQINY